MWIQVGIGYRGTGLTVSEKGIQYGLYAITNFVWTVSLYISNATGYVVQEAYKLDFISDTANSIGKNIQTLAGVTSSGVFQ